MESNFLNWIFLIEFFSPEIKLQQGQCSSSFGVNVAKLAEMPEPILQRAIGKKHAYIKIITSSLYTW